MLKLNQAYFVSRGKRRKYELNCQTSHTYHLNDMPSFERSVFTHMHASAFSNAYEVKASYVKVSLDTVHLKFKTSGLLCNSTNLEYEGFNSEYETVVPLKILDKTRTRMVTKTSTYCVVTKRMRMRSCQRLELRAKKKELLKRIPLRA